MEFLFSLILFCSDNPDTCSVVEQENKYFLLNCNPLARQSAEGVELYYPNQHYVFLDKVLYLVTDNCEYS